MALTRQPVQDTATPQTTAPATAPDQSAQSLMGNAAIMGMIPGLGAVQHGLDTVGDIWSHEGLGAVLDPVGALDRENARNELASRFQIVGDDYTGERRGNTVTQAEYDRVVETYSNIRLGRGDLTMDTSELSDADAAQWRSGAMGDIATMMQTPSGRRMVETLSNNPRLDDAGNERQFLAGHDVTGTWLEGLGSGEHAHTTLRAYHQDANGNDRNDDDDAAPLAHDNAMSDDLFPDDQRDRSELQADGSRGLGANPIIRYNPDNTGRIDVDGDGVPNQTTSDIVLMHEMAHAWHQTQGTLATGQVQAGDIDLLAVRQGAPIWPLPTIGANDPDLGDPANGIDPVNRSEHQAAGMGIWGLDPMTENQYRQEKAALGMTQPDGNPIPLRPNYSTLP